MKTQLINKIANWGLRHFSTLLRGLEGGEVF